MDKFPNRARNTKETLSIRSNNSTTTKQRFRATSSTGNILHAKRTDNVTRSSHSQSVSSNQTPRPSVAGVRNSVASSRNSRAPPGRINYNNKQHRNTKVPERDTRTYASYSGDFGSILRLPRKIRLLIWNRLRWVDQLRLRQTCSIVKKDIDSFIGVKAELDDVDESFPYLIKIGIKNAIILDIPSINGKFLQHPELLKELTILGGIKTSCFVNIMKECHNIVHLVIHFTKDLFALKPRLFPVMINDKVSANVLTRLKYIEFHSTTKTDMELEYVKRNFIALVNNHLLGRIHPHTIRVTIVHKFYNEIIEECSQLMSALVYDNMHVIRDLEVDIKYLGTLGLPEDVDNSGNGDEENDYIANFFDMDDYSDEHKEVSWQLFPNLKNLHFSLNPKDYQCFWREMPQHILFLETLYLEIHSPVSWDYYKAFIKGCEPTLETVILDSTYNYDSRRRARAIDLGVFKKCKHLESLFLSQGKHHAIHNSKVKNICKLPRSIEDVELEYLILTPCQVFNLLKSPRLHHLRIGYWSASDGSFGRLLWLLKWAYSCSCTTLNEFIIVDLKIRFQHNKKTLDVLLKRSSLLVDYTDFNETMLVLKKKNSK